MAFQKTVNEARYWGVLEGVRTKLQAQEAEDEIVYRIRRGEYTQASKDKTLAQYVEQDCTPWARENKKSWRSDESMLKPIVEKLGKKKLSKISSFDLEKYKSERRKSTTVRVIRNGDEVEHKPRAKSSVNKELKLLRRIFNMAKVKPNPFQDVEFIRGETKRKRWMKKTEFEALLPCLTEGRRSHLLDIVMLDLNTGLRQKELLCLTPTDVDFE